MLTSTGRSRHLRTVSVTTFDARCGASGRHEHGDATVGVNASYIDRGRRVRAITGDGCRTDGEEKGGGRVRCGVGGGAEVSIKVEVVWRTTHSFA